MTQPPSAPTKPPSAGFTWPGLAAIWAGYSASFLIFCGGYGVALLVIGFGGDTEFTSEPDPGLLRVMGVLAVPAALAIVAGYLGAVLAARRHNRSRGEGAGRPRLTWRIALSPRGLSRWLFTPRGVYEVDDPGFGRLGMARSLAGLAVFVVVIFYHEPTGLLDYGEQLFIQASNAVVVAAVVLLATTVVVFALVDAGQRGRAARALGRPLLTALCAGAALAGLALSSLVYLSPPEDFSGQPQRIAESEPVELLWILMWTPLTPHLLWALLFVGCAVYYLARNMFNAADAHPLLPPTLTLGVTWALTGISLLGSFGVEIRLPVADVPLPIPTGVATVLSLIGTATVTGLAVWEIIWLRNKGLRLRAGPWR